MSEKRTLTIGVAINLGNYESLRLEVSDVVQNEEEAAELAAYLNRVLDGYGQNDASTRASVDKYRARVLEKYAEAESPVPAADPLDELFGPAPTADDITADEEVPAPVTEILFVEEECISEISPEPVITEQVFVPEPEPEPVKIEPVQPEPEQPLPAAEKTAEEPVVYTCEKCGATVSKVQRDVSNLFMGKTLCKACMK
ncbi:hypothetical protein [Methanorbis furvi]|uniref:Uncharacterized protein n=1 Tax=Methanorbis furvi TaxID=3028299 RepID=A0AAE4MDQ7_9EURY|nr:hypothetical protein [Methanocorpusculaceae archaeon Ag1]